MLPPLLPQPPAQGGGHPAKGPNFSAFLHFSSKNLQKAIKNRSLREAEREETFLFIKINYPEKFKKRMGCPGSFFFSRKSTIFHTKIHFFSPIYLLPFKRLPFDPCHSPVVTHGALHPEVPGSIPPAPPV